MRWVLVWLAMGCAGSSESERHDQFNQTTLADKDATSSGRYDFKQETGASWSAQLKFAPPRTAAEQLGPLTEASLSGQGPSLAELVGVAQAQSKEHDTGAVAGSGEAQASHAWHLGPGFWGWVGLAFGAVAAALLAWKFRSGLASGALGLFKPRA